MRNTETGKQTNTNKCRVETTMKGFKCKSVNRYRMVTRKMVVQSLNVSKFDKEMKNGAVCIISDIMPGVNAATDTIVLTPVLGDQITIG